MLNAKKTGPDNLIRLKKQNPKPLTNPNFESAVIPLQTKSNITKQQSLTITPTIKSRHKLSPKKTVTRFSQYPIIFCNFDIKEL